MHRNYALLIFCLLSLLLSACVKNGDETYDQSKIIRIEFDVDTAKLFANQVSLLEMRAIIDPKAGEDFKKVTFTTNDDLGAFQGVVENKKLTVMADNAGIAKAIIKVSSTPGTYFVSASVTGSGKTHKTQDYKIVLQPVPLDSLIKLEFESDTAGLRADYQSFIKVKVKIPAHAPTGMRNVTFINTANLGEFQGTATDSKNAVTANADGIARATIQVSGIPGTYFLAAQIKDGDKIYRTADFPIYLRSVPFAERLSVQVINNHPPADGYSLVKLIFTAKYTKEKTISLTTNAGAFAGSSDPGKQTLNLDDQGIATANLRISNEIKPHLIGATIGQGTPLVTIIEPIVSYTETIDIEPSALKIDTTGGNVKLTVTLKKLNLSTFVSKNTDVLFEAYQEIAGVKVPVGRFTGNKTPATAADGQHPTMAAFFYADTGNIIAGVPITIVVKALKNATEYKDEKIKLTIK